MHFFGTIGTLSFLTGFLISLYIIGDKLYRIYDGQHLNRDVTDQPLFYIALVMTIIGTQLFLTGFLAEMVGRNSHDRNNYKIEEEV
jgi:hypothetical protein